MYHPRLIAARQEALLAQPAVRALYPQGLPEYSVRDARALTAQIYQTRDPDSGKEIRPLTAEESRFAAVAQLRIMFDAPWFLECFVWIDEEAHGIRPLYPLWESQTFVLSRLAALELQHHLAGSRDGLLVNILKARQLGITTFDMSLVAHRVLTQPYIRSITGSDVEEQARYMFKMIERIYDQLPFFLKPDKIVPYQAGREINFSNKSSIKAAWGKTTRGALQAEGGRKGNIERGRTNSVVGISELATWDNPEQLDSSLLPGIPISPMTLVMFESTAELAGDWWHRHWQACQDGSTPRDWTNIFIPWCVEPSKYSLRPPAGWSPVESTRATAAVIERDSAQWVGSPIRLTRDQLYWYESTRKYYIDKNQLHQFLKEYPSNPEECVVGDTRVSTEMGLIPIKDAQAATHTEAGTVSQWWDRGLRETFKVRTKAGREFSATAEHLVALADGTWKAVTDLHLSDTISLSPPHFFVLEPAVVTWPWSPVCQMSVVVNEDLARFIGFFVGDGSWVGGGIETACAGADVDVVAEVARLVEKIIGKAPTYAHRGGCTIVRSSNKRWREIWSALGLLTVKTEDNGWKAGYCKRLRVPECIWRSPKSVVAAFLSGLFESDGHANKNGPQTSLFSKSEDLIRDVQLLLLGFGINAAYHTAVKHHRGKTFTGRYLRLNAQNTVIFHREIGFVGARKRSRPHLLGGRGKGGRKASLVEMTDQVLSVEPAGRQQVYDIGVDVTHYFGANGVKVHNCFQYAGRSVFTFDEIARIDAAARPLLDVWRVEPSRDIADLKRLPPEDPDRDAQRQIDHRRYPTPTSTKVPTATADQQLVPAGYGFRRLTKTEVQELPSLRHTVMAIWEYPRSRGHRRYIIAVDVGDGLGQDYSVVSVIRQPTIEEPAEEVAQYVSNTVRPSELAFIVDAIGHFYQDEDGIEACAAVELNNHGITVQDLLQLHLGYTHFYVWEVVDAADASARFTKRIGWQTTTRTRPILLEKFHDAVTTVDPISSIADLRLNSPTTRAELRFFVTEGLLGEAEHAKGQHDDSIFATAIGYYVAYRLSGGEAEPLAERRRRRAQLAAHNQDTGAPRRDYRNSSVSAEAAQHGDDDDADESLTNPDGQADVSFYDPRRHA